MLRTASIATLVGIAILLSGGCERKAPANKTKDATPPAAATPEHSPDDGHKHAGDIKADDHAGHDHGEADHEDDAGDDDDKGHGHGGERHVLGSREVAGLTVEVVQFGAATGNIAQLIFELDVQGEPAPTAVRLLVRASDGAESLKVKASKIGDHGYDAHVGELPKQLGEGSVLVVELEMPSGTETLTFTLKT